MKERKPGCICELNSETGEPEVENYEMCPVHKSDAPTPIITAFEIYQKFAPISSNKLAAQEGAEICINEIINVIKTFGGHSYAIVLLPHYEQAKKEIPHL